MSGRRPRLRRTATAALVLASAAALAYGLREATEARPAGGVPTAAARIVGGWPRLPATTHLGQATGVGAGANGEVYVFHRPRRPWNGEPLDPRRTIAAAALLVLDGATGRLRRSFGARRFVMPHGLAVAPGGSLWLTDVGLHQVFEVSPAGRVLRVFGQAGVPGADARHFDLPTDVAVAPDGSVYVSDGYGNGRIVHLSPDGRFLNAWGTRGSGPGELLVPHGIAVDGRGRVYVADRENARVQVFDGRGRLLAIWKGPQYGRPWAVRARGGRIYLLDGGDPAEPTDRGRVLVCDPDGHVLAELGSSGGGALRLVQPHALALGPGGAVYVGELGPTPRVLKLELAADGRP